MKYLAADEVCEACNAAPGFHSVSCTDSPYHTGRTMKRYIIRRNGIPQYIDPDMVTRDVEHDEDASAFSSKTGAEMLADTFAGNKNAHGNTLRKLRESIRNLGRGDSVWVVQEVEV